MARVLTSGKKGLHVDNDLSVKNQTIDILGDFSTQVLKATKTITDSLAAATRSTIEISTLSSKTSQSLEGSLDNMGLPSEMAEALSLLSQSLLIFGDQLKDINSSFSTNLQKPMESILKTEIPSAKLKKELINKATKDLAEYKAKHAAIRQKRVDSAKLFELEQEESLITNAVQSARTDGVPVIEDALSSFSRTIMGSAAGIIETFTSHCTQGVTYYQPCSTRGNTLKGFWVESRKEAFSTCPGGDLWTTLGIDESIWQGSLNKKAGQGRHWQSRFCVLKPSYLYYFDGNTLKGSIPLRNSSVTKDSYARSHSHSFSVVHGDRVYKFDAKDEADKMSWFTALLGCCGLGEGDGKKPTSVAEKRRSGRPYLSKSEEYDDEGDEWGSGEGDLEGENGRHQELEGAVSSEKVYLANLESYKVYRFNIQKEEILQDLSQLFSVFELLDELFSLHATLLTKLETILNELGNASEGSDAGLGSCFLSCLPTFQVYSMYAKLFSQLKVPLAKACENLGVKRVLETIRKKSATKFTLNELLVLPLHRLQRYIPLLKQFQNSCSPDHSNRETLNVTLEKMTKLVESLESHISSEENEENVLRIERQLNNYPHSLYIHGRSFLLEAVAVVQKKGGEKLSGHENLTDLFKRGGECTLFLFSDILIVTTQRLLLNQYNFVEQIQLPHIQELKLENDSSISLKVREGKGLIVFSLSFSSSEKGRDLFGKMKEARDLAVSKRVFGVPIEVLFQQPNNQNRDIPEWLEDAILHVSLYSLKTEGIFRISPTASSIQAFKDDLDEGKHVTFDKTTDPHVVACLIKLWLRELPEKLIPQDCYNALAMAVAKEESEKKEVMRRAIESRPEHIQFLLQHLFCFMRLVASYSEFSKMTPSNLSIVFAPNLVAAEISLDPNLNKLVEQLVLFYDEVFGGVEKRRMEKKKKMFLLLEEQKRSQKEINERMMKESEFSAGAGPASTPSFTSQVLKQGYLTKKGEVRRNWTTRWFVLRYNWLGYYKSPEEINNVPKGSIILKECTFEDTSRARTFSFSVHDPRQNRTFQIQAKNAVEHQEWCEAIRKMIAEVSKD